MELNRIPENLEGKAKSLIEGVSENFKKIEDKAQENIKQAFNIDWLSDNEKVEELKDRFINEKTELKDKASAWIEETYSNILDAFGVATKDEVEGLRKKLATLQRKVQKMNKQFTAKS